MHGGTSGRAQTLGIALAAGLGCHGSVHPPGGPGGASTADHSSASSSGQGGAGSKAESDGSSSTGGAGSTGGSTRSTAMGAGGAGGAGGGPSCAPAQLVGLYWTGVGWESARLDPTSGELTLLRAVAVATQGGVAPSFSTYDPTTAQIYELDDTTVYTLDGNTGALLDAAALPSSTVFNPVVNNAGELIVLHGEQSAVLDPETGAVTDLAPLPFADGYELGMRAFDPGTNRIYQFAYPSLVTIDGDTGITLAVSPLPSPGLLDPVVNDAGEILAIQVAPGAPHVARLDPVTGALTALAPLPLSGVFTLGMSAHDPCTDRIYQLRDGFVLTLDGASGAVISLVSTPQKNFGDFAVVR